MKYYLPILLFSFLGLVSCRNDTHTLNIIQVSGLLYEKTAQQDVMLTITETNITKISPSSIKQAAIKEEGNTNIYPVNLVCADKKVLNPYSFVKCKIDLSNIPQGLYKIILLIHGSEHYIINNFVPFLIQGSKLEEKNIELIDVIANATEYSTNQEISFLFTKNEINPQLILSMVITSNGYDKYNIPLSCPIDGYKTWIKCYGDFSKIRENWYAIQKIDYTNGFIYPSRNVTIKVHKKYVKDLKLLDIKGDAIKGKSILDLTFNKNVIGDLFSFFYLFNGNNFYNLTSTVLTKYSNSTSISVNFDFTYIPEGAYHLSTMYQGIEYKFSNLFINIKNNMNTRYRLNLSYIMSSFLGGVSKNKSNLRMPKNIK